MKFVSVIAPGFSFTGVIGSMLAAGVCAFIFASCVTSKNANIRKVFAVNAPVRWWCLALFMPVLFYLLGYLFLWTTGQEFSFFLDPDLTLSNWILYSVRSVLFTLLIVAVGEEVGWRGWMLPRLLQQYNPLKSSIILGLVWGAGISLSFLMVSIPTVRNRL